MTQPLLSILIPTVVERESQLNNLIGLLCGKHTAWGVWEQFNNIDIRWQYIKTLNGEIEIIVGKDNKEKTIGEKREQMYQLAKGLYSIQVDDDDELAPNAIELILEAIKRNPGVDCITFEEHIDIDGKIQRSNHSLKYDDWHDNYDGYDYVRTPFFKSVIKTEIAKSVPIPHIRFGEDHQWAQALKPHLQSEIHIPEQLYRYIHRSSNPTERYGLDRG